MAAIALFDPSIASGNLGDEIISLSCRIVLAKSFPGSTLISLPTRSRPGWRSRKLVEKVDTAIIGGSNILRSHQARNRQWAAGLLDLWWYPPTILMGVGWWQYQGKVGAQTKSFLRQILGSGFLHSVRDSYTLSKLEEVGIRNAVNTGCPTMWSLNPEHLKKITRTPSSKIVFTLTDYAKNPSDDLQLVLGLLKRADKIYFWPQGVEDLGYLRNLLTGRSSELSKIEVLPPNVSALDNLLESEPHVEYVGTRLHAGIRALQKFKRASIVGVDNRALEISRDTGLSVLPRHEINQLDSFLDRNSAVELTLNWEGIEAWISQFPKTISEPPR